MSQATRDQFTVEKAERLKQLPPYLFVEIDRAKQRLAQQGHDVIDLGVGDPDLPTPEPIIHALQRSAGKPSVKL